MMRSPLTRVALAGAALTFAGGFTAATTGAIGASTVAASGEASEAAAAHRSNDHGAAQSTKAKDATKSGGTVTTTTTTPELLPCTSEFSNHGQYVSQNASAVVSLGKLGRVENHGRPDDPNMVGELVRQAAQSDCGKPDGATREEQDARATASQGKSQSEEHGRPASPGSKGKGHTKTR